MAISKETKRWIIAAITLMVLVMIIDLLVSHHH